MIRHICKVIWNERKANGLIVLEYIVVFCILWFCVDYLYYMGRNFSEPLGYDIKNTYRIQMGQKEVESEISGQPELTEDNLYDYAMTFLNRVKRYPDVENVSFSHAAIPYGFSTHANGFIINSDSLIETIYMKWVTSEFFDVFRMKVEGNIFNWEDKASDKLILISPDRTGDFGQYAEARYPVGNVHTLRYNQEDETPFRVIGIVNKVKTSFVEPYQSTMFRPMERNQLNLAHMQIIVRAKPGAEKGFEKRFTDEMKTQLNIGPFYLVSVDSFGSIKKKMQELMRTDEELNSIYAITFFVIINIFLGLIGTFWYRTQSRRSEIGLRIALGATKRKIKSFMFTETLLLLFISSVVAVNICVNIAQTDILEAIGVPLADKIQIGSGAEQGFINYILTFLFLAIVSLLAVWYPAKQSSDMHPAEALHEE